MSERFFVVAIKWDQKKGGSLESASPGSLTLSTKTSMTLYNMHRMSQKDPNFSTISLVEDNTQYNICSFYSGYGTSTSPDGFTGNYATAGSNIIGVAEKVLCLFLPVTLVPEQYSMVLAKIASRALLDAELVHDRIEKIGQFVQSSNLLKSAKELQSKLDAELDRELNLSDTEKCLANEQEIKILRYLMIELQENSQTHQDQKSDAEIAKLRKRLKEAYTSLEEANNRIKLLEAYKTQKEQYIKKLEENTPNLVGFEPESQNNHKNAEIVTNQADNKVDDSKDLMIENLKDINSSLEDQIRGISDSMKGLIEDLKKALVVKENKLLQKDAFIEKLITQIKNTKDESIRGSMETEICENSSEILIQEYRAKIETLTKELEKAKEELGQKEKQVIDLELELEMEKNAK